MEDEDSFWLEKAMSLTKSGEGDADGKGRKSVIHGREKNIQLS